MINLLPLKEKEELKQEENLKLVLILAILTLLFLVSFYLILYSINNFITGKVEIQKILYQQKEKEFENPRIQTLQNNLLSLNQTLTQLESFYRSQFNLSEVLEKISQLLPSEAYFSNLSTSQRQEGKEEKLICSLSGFSPTRQILLEFKEKLEKEGSFKNIYFPPGNWVQASNIDFTVSFQVK